MNIDFNYIDKAFSSGNNTLLKIYGPNQVLLWDSNSIPVKDLFTITANEPSTVQIKDTYTDVYVYYSINGSSFNRFTYTNNTETTKSNTYYLSNTVSLAKGDVMKIYGYGSNYHIGGRYIGDIPSGTTVININPGAGTLLFKISGDVSLSGKLQSVHSRKRNFSTELYNNCFAAMFYGCTGITDISDLILPGLVESTTSYSQQYFYTSTFEGCSNLTNMPIWDNISDSDWSNYYTFKQMFKDCTSLTGITLPILSVIHGQDYYEMFKGCTGIASIGNLVLGEVKNSACRYMFSGCTSLASVGNISFTDNYTSNSGTYSLSNMFSGCTSLVSVGNIAAAECMSTDNMFDGCISLTTVGNITANLISYAREMFSGCTSLVNAPSITANTVQNMSRMFTGCTSLVNASTLNINNISNNTSLDRMYNNCTSLTNAKALSFDTWGSSGDIDTGVFYGCSSLTIGPIIDLERLGTNANNRAFRAVNNGSSNATRLIFVRLKDTKVANTTDYDKVYTSSSNDTSHQYIVFITEANSNTYDPINSSSLHNNWDYLTYKPSTNSFYWKAATANSTPYDSATLEDKGLTGVGNWLQTFDCVTRNLPQA